MPGDLDDQVLRHRLLALRADIGDSTQDVQFRHVPGRTAGRDLVADGAVTVNGPFAAVPGKTPDVDEIELGEAACTHVVGVHEDDGAQVVVGVDGRVELVVRTDRRQNQPAVARVEVVGKWRRRELGAVRGSQEDTFPRGLVDAEAVRVPGSRVEVVEPVEHLGHRVADAVVVVGVVLPGRVAVRQRGPGQSGEDRALRTQLW